MLQALCEAHPDGIASVADLEAQADQLLAREELVRIPDPAGTRYTTRAQIELEQGLLDSVERRQDRNVARAEPKQIEKAVAGRGLSNEQERAVREMTTWGRGVEVLRAPAGAGKTFALDAAREAWQASGKQVIGCALSAQAARELRDQAGIETETIARLKKRLERGHQLERDSVLIVDEAGMVGVRDLKLLADFAELRLPRLFIEDGHVDHGYATTAHKAQGATFDEALVLGSQEAYREWGYTALSRHRDEARFYIATPKPFINREPAQSTTPNSSSSTSPTRSKTAAATNSPSSSSNASSRAGSTTDRRSRSCPSSTQTGRSPTKTD